MGATLWATSVSKEVLETVEPEERKRQEAINEFIFTERDFVKDLEYLRDVSSAYLISFRSNGGR
jgi:regulator of sirC expression with transglutaminase-like and TPR domain